MSIYIYVNIITSVYRDLPHWRSIQRDCILCKIDRVLCKVYGYNLQDNSRLIGLAITMNS